VGLLQVLFEPVPRQHLYFNLQEGGKDKGTELDGHAHAEVRFHALTTTASYSVHVPRIISLPLQPIC